MAGTVSASLPTVWARSGISIASRHCRLASKNKFVHKSQPLASSSQLEVRREYEGLRSVSNFKLVAGSNTLIYETHKQTKISHSECPLWSTPQAGWKQEIVWTKVTVSESKRAAKELVTLKLDISAVPELKTGFTKPGQFVQVKVGEAKPTFMAIASTPEEAQKGVLEFLIKDVEGSTAALLCDLKVGAEVEVSQVLGGGFPVEASLSPSEEFSSVLIFATGSGISPIRSVIEHGFEADKRADVRLYYGAESLEAMAYQDRFAAWEASGVKVIPVLSNGGDEWDGETGFVQAAYKRGEKLADPSKAGAIICGQKELLEELTAILTEDGFSKEKLLTNF